VILSGVQGQPFRLLKRGGLGRVGGSVEHVSSYERALGLVSDEQRAHGGGSSAGATP
jgi:hypothetical protein